MESGGVPGRVHISEATLKCLNGAYEVEPGNGESRDNHLKMSNIKTYLIKRTEPLRARKNRLTMIENCNKEDQPQKFVDPKFTQNNCVNGNHQHNNQTNGSQLMKRLSKSIITQDDEPATDWKPEIPFKNVSNLLKRRY